MSPAPQLASVPALEFAGVGLHLGAREILRDVSLTLATGESLALVGPSGAGKSTVARLAVGELAPTRGEVRLAGASWAGLSAAQRRRRCAEVQMIYQDPYRSLDPTMTIADAICEGVEIQATLGTRPPLPRGRARRDWRRELATEWLRKVGLAPELTDRKPAHLSGGQRQRVAIARALALAPRLLLADEPTAALDGPTSADLLALLRELQRTIGIACLLVTHHLALAAGFAKRMAILDAGEIVEQGETAAVLRSPRHPRTRALLEATPPWPPFASSN